jgi:hypothetical protein
MLFVKHLLMGRLPFASNCAIAYDANKRYLLQVYTGQVPVDPRNTEYPGITKRTCLGSEST